MKKRYAVYMRVSTSDQDVASQRHEIEKWLQARPAGHVTWYIDHGISGKTMNRPAYNEMCAAVAAKRHDAVVVYRLDRVGRLANRTLATVLGWLNDDIEFFAVAQPVLHLGKENPMRLTLMAAFAEFAQLERDALISRIKSGQSAARARGQYIGGVAKVTAETAARIKHLAARGHTAAAISRELNIPRTSVRRWMAKDVCASTPCKN